MEKKINQIRILLAVMFLFVIANTIGFILFGKSIREDVTDTAKKMILDNSSSEFQIRSVVEPKFDRVDSLLALKADLEDIKKLNIILIPMAGQVNDLWENSNKNQ